MNNYFSHDSNARDDEKILAMRIDLGWEAYGLYWALVEMLRDASDYKLKANYKVLAFSLHTTTELLQQIICNYGLFCFSDDGDTFFSASLTKRMEEKEIVSKKRRASAGNRWSKTTTDDANAEQDGCKCNANAMQMHSTDDANAMQMHSTDDANAMQMHSTDDANAMQMHAQSKVNKSKVKESKEDYSSPRTRESASAPSEEEKEEFYKIFFWRNMKEPGTECEKFIRHNEQYGWRMNNTPAKRKAAAESWMPEAKGTRVSERFLSAWAALYKRVVMTHPFAAAQMLNEGSRIAANNGSLVIHADKLVQDYIRENKPPEIMSLANGNPIRYAWP